VREIAFFAPTDEAPVAAVLCLPDERPRGIVMTLPGTGLHRTIGSNLCARAAVRLAEHNLASIRFDYHGAGDSPGLLAEWRLSDLESATNQARAVLEVARETVGAREFALIGTCYGSRVSLRLFDDDDCVGAVWLAAPIVEHGTWSSLRGTARKSRLLSRVRTHPVLRALVVRPLRFLLRERKFSSQLLSALARLDRAPALLLYGGATARDNYDDLSVRHVRDAASRNHAGRLDVRILPTGPLTAFDMLPESDTRLILDTVVPWTVECFERRAGQEEAGRDRLGVTAR
jgi:hypothetical protein